MSISKYLRSIKYAMRKSIILSGQRRRLKNTTFSLITNDCLGCIKLHELGLKFNSPTVNLWMYPEDFVKFCNNIDSYLQAEIKFFERGWGGYNYPVGQLNDITLYFQHYKTSEEAKVKWIERSQRVDLANIFFIMSIKGNEIDAPKLVQTFNCLKSPHVIFTDTESKIKGNNVFYCGCDKYGFFHGYVSKLSIRKHFDKFDFVGWFNKSVVQS